MTFSAEDFVFTPVFRLVCSRQHGSCRARFPMNRRLWERVPPLPRPLQWGVEMVIMTAIRISAPAECVPLCYFLHRLWPSKFDTLFRRTRWMNSIQWHFSEFCLIFKIRPTLSRIQHEYVHNDVHSSIRSRVEVLVRWSRICPSWMDRSCSCVFDFDENQ